MYVIVCYDVVDDRIRGRLCKRLKGFLRHVQKSVFEGPLPARRYSALRSAINDTIDWSCDTVRLYHLCRGCRIATELMGTAEGVPLGPEDVVV